MKTLIIRLWRNQSGATAIEYGLIAALLSITILGTALGLGGGIEARFNQVDAFVAQ